MKGKRTRWSTRGVAILAALMLSMSACASGGTGTSGSQDTSAASFNGPVKGQHITVVVPPWAQVPKDTLARFSKETGVSVTLNVTSWDNIRDKVVVAGAGGSTLGDVTEFDWSWTGQFGRAGWYMPLEKALPASILSGLQNNGAFTFSGHQYAACYSNDFRISAYNTNLFARAGIAKPPTTFSALLGDLKKLKGSGVQYPLTLPLSATEGTATQWYLLTLAMGGQLFDENFKPLFNEPGSAGYKALQFEVGAVQSGLVDPGSISMTDTQSGAAYTSGRAAVILAGGPDEMVTANDPKQSSISGDAAFMLIPGRDGPGPTFGLPEGLGIMSSSTHKAAALAFVKWWMQKSTQLTLYKKLGLLPCSSSAVHTLVNQGALKGGAAIETELPHLSPLFPQGAPPWYTRFSTEASSLINAAAKGSMSVPEALDQLASEARSMSSGQ